MPKIYLLVIAGFPMAALAASIADWQGLIKQERYDEAKTLCTPEMQDKDPMVAAEAYKCMSNLALVGKDVVTIDPGENGEVPLGSGFSPEAADASIGYLDKALALSPNDLSIHLGRLYVLMESLRYNEMVDALKDSLAKYHGVDAHDDWLGYSHKLGQRAKYSTAIEYLKVLETKYPDDGQIMGNIGAFYLDLDQDNQAIAYLKRAVKVAPDDAIDNWDLGLAYEGIGDYKRADAHFQNALRHDKAHTGGDPLSGNEECAYKEFVYEKLKDQKRACDIQVGACTSQKSECPSH